MYESRRTVIVEKVVVIILNSFFTMNNKPGNYTSSPTENRFFFVQVGIFKQQETQTSLAAKSAWMLSFWGDSEIVRKSREHAWKWRQVHAFCGNFSRLSRIRKRLQEWENCSFFSDIPFNPSQRRCHNFRSFLFPRLVRRTFPWFMKTQGNEGELWSCFIAWAMATK